MAQAHRTSAKDASGTISNNAPAALRRAKALVSCLNEKIFAPSGALNSAMDAKEAGAHLEACVKAINMLFPLARPDGEKGAVWAEAKALVGELYYLRGMLHEQKTELLIRSGSTPVFDLLKAGISFDLSLAHFNDAHCAPNLILGAREYNEWRLKAHDEAVYSYSVLASIFISGKAQPLSQMHLGDHYDDVGRAGKYARKAFMHSMKGGNIRAKMLGEGA